MMGDGPLLDYEGPRPRRRRTGTDWEFWTIVSLPLLVVVFAVIYFTAMILFDHTRLP
jgi:hypothetical protein